MAKNRYPKLHFNNLQMYMGYPYEINLDNAVGKITIYEPTIGDIAMCGEKEFFSTLSVFISNTTSYRLPLWQSGQDWNKISDFQLFIMIYKSINLEVSKLIFHDLDFSKFIPLEKNGEVTLYNPEDEIEINESVYQHIAQYLRCVFNMHPAEKITNDPILKRQYIAKDKRDLEYEKQNKKDEEKSNLRTLISSCVNHPGFKYNMKQLRDVGVCEFYDSVSRLQIYESATACMKGLYSGMVDGKKISPDSYNFMKEI